MPANQLAHGQCPDSIDEGAQHIALPAAETVRRTPRCALAEPRSVLSNGCISSDSSYRLHVSLHSGLNHVTTLAFSGQKLDRTPAQIAPALSLVAGWRRSFAAGAAQRLQACRSRLFATCQRRVRLRLTAPAPL
jgi:hypothetical protein